MLSQTLHSVYHLTPCLRTLSRIFFVSLLALFIRTQLPFCDILMKLYVIINYELYIGFLWSVLRRCTVMISITNTYTR